MQSVLYQRAKGVKEVNNIEWREGSASATRRLDIDENILMTILRESNLSEEQIAIAKTSARQIEITFHRHSQKQKNGYGLPFLSKLLNFNIRKTRD